jgi:hypothetical protein
MVATIAAVVVLAVGGGGYFLLMKNNNADAHSAVPQGDSATGTKASPLSSVKSISLDSAFREIEALTDFSKGADAATARRAFVKLDSVAPLAQTDSDRVHIQLLKTESHFVQSEVAPDSATKASELKAGCDILKDVEGKAAPFRFKKRFDSYLYGDPKNHIPKTC